MRTRERISAAVGVAALAAAVLLGGGAFRWTQAVVTLLVGIAIVGSALSRRTFSRIPPLIATLCAAAGLTLLQLLPMPASILEWLQPVGTSLRDDGAALVGTSPWPSLSLDPPGTLRALCFFITLIGVAWLALRMTVTSSGRYRVMFALGCVCGVTALVTGVHELLGADQLYGLYKPKFFRPIVLGPLLNTNHLGCLMAVGAMVSAGLAMETKQRSLTRVLWLGNVAACGVLAVASHSRGATLALVVGSMITAGVIIAQRLFKSEGRMRASFFTTSLPAALVALSAIVVIIYASAGHVSAELSRTTLDEVQAPLSKFAIWRASARLVEESPWVGVGRGAFEPAITHTHPSAAQASFSHVENEYIQAIVDWGIPGACLLAIGLAWLFVAGFRRWRDGPLAAGALGGITVIALQSIVDFGIQLLGLAIPLVLLVACVTYVPLRETDGRPRKLALSLRGLLLAGLIASTILLFTSFTTSVAEDHDATDPAASLADLRDRMERHPLDYHGFAIAARTLYRAHDPRAVNLLNHALRLHPTHPGLHHMAARVLVQSKYFDQAAIEYAFALRGVADPRPLLQEIVTQLPPKYAAMAVPVDIASFDTTIKSLIELDRSRTVTVNWLVRVVTARPNDIRACEQLYSVAIDNNDISAAERASTRCLENSLDHKSRLALATMLLKAGRYTDSARLVRDAEEWQGRIDTRVAGWLVKCDIEIAQSHWDEAKRCLRKLDVSGFVQDERAQVTARIEQIEAALRQPQP